MQHKCFKCSTEFDGSFCPECGERWQESKTCPKCGATLAGNAKFCNECGYSFVPKDRSQMSPPAPAPISAPIPPKKMEKPQRPHVDYHDIVPEDQREELMPKMVRYIKKKRAFAGVFLLCLALNLSIAFSILTLKFNLISVSLIVYGFAIPLTVVSLGIIVWSIFSHNETWEPRKIYRSEKLHLLFISVLMSFLGSFSCLNEWWTDIKLSVATFVTLICVLVCSLIVSIVLIFIEFMDRKRLCIVLCGYDDPSKNPELKERYDKERQEFSEKFAEYKRQKEIYLDNKRRWQVYRYQMSRYSKGKPYETVPHVFVWCSIHKAALSVTAVALAAVITITCVFTLRDTRFRTVNLVKIGLGADEKRVTDVLGEPFQKETREWYYYSKNFVSIRKEMDELEEKAMNMTSLEELEKLIEDSEKLEEKMKTLEYQAIIVSFSADNNVNEMTLDMAAVYETREKKEVKTCEIEPKSYRMGSDTKVSYSITYTDGSYCTAYFARSQLPTETGEQTIKWSNVWGNYTATIMVTRN